MTAWWVSTTRVRKVRARSSERFRTLALGTAPTSAGPTAEIDVMRASRPGCLCRMLPPGTRFSKSYDAACGHAANSIRLSAHFLDRHLVRIEGQAAGDLSHGRERCFI